MVCTVNELSAWKDFPKGLKVLLIEEDSSSATEMKSKLESLDYVVSIFCNESEALSAIADNPDSYHVAIVEVNASNTSGSFKFLETAKDLPTIMTSSTDCLSTMMKCIALGAVEFLRKPISEDKLKNIWQHVVHKAFNAGENSLSESLKPVKNFVSSALQLQVDTELSINETTEEARVSHEPPPGSDKYPAPSTPQQKQGFRLLDDPDCQDHTNSSSGKECGESKSVETTFPMNEVSQHVDRTFKEEDDSVDRLKSAENPTKASSLPHGTRATRKKAKVDWTPELHKKFVKAVEQLGVDHAIPSKILEVMKVEGLTRHNVASHLQKYRMNRRHILPKEDDRKWLQQRDHMQWSYYQHKPIMAYPPYRSNHTYPYGPVYPMWGQTGWGPPIYRPWTPTESWHSNLYPGMQADALGFPVIPPQNPYSSPIPNVTGFHDTGSIDNSWNVPQNSFDEYPAQEVIDKVVREAMSQPWQPLPLGLKPPATDSVLAELSRQGISRVPPQLNDVGAHCKDSDRNQKDLLRPFQAI